MKLYSSSFNSLTTKIRIACHEKGLRPQSSVMATREDPCCTVACHGFIVMIDAECVLEGHEAILDYLEMTYPQPPLWPHNPRERERCRTFEEFGDLLIAPNAECLADEIVRKAPALARDRNLIERASAKLHQAYYRLDRELQRRQFLCDQFSIADVACLAPLILAAQMGVPPASNHPSLCLWLRAMLQRPSAEQENRELRERLRSGFVSRNRGAALTQV